MTPSTKTLGQAIDRLPVNLRGRYDTMFFVEAANEILQEFESATDDDYLRDEGALLLEKDVNDYRLPAVVRRILEICRFERRYPVSCCPNTSATFNIQLGYALWDVYVSYAMNRQVVFNGNIAVSRQAANLGNVPPSTPGVFEVDGAAYTYWNVFESLEAYNTYIADFLS